VVEGKGKAPPELPFVLVRRVMTRLVALMIGRRLDLFPGGDPDRFVADILASRA